jgi:hypothetical protein
MLIATWKQELLIPMNPSWMSIILWIRNFLYESQMGWRVEVTVRVASPNMVWISYLQMSAYDDWEHLWFCCWRWHPVVDILFQLNGEADSYIWILNAVTVCIRQYFGTFLLWKKVQCSTITFCILDQLLPYQSMYIHVQTIVSEEIWKVGGKGIRKETHIL